ncbi:MAG: sensor histidine kinase [Chloroflexi bacterium]|nr:sensor histidine kinase [Chloroflexota bacterium]
MTQSSPTASSPLASLLEHCQRELERTHREMKEIDILIRQSEAEVEKLAQRNAQLATRVRQVEMNIETYPRADLAEIFSSAQDAQTRLFMMRGQLEQLVSKRESHQRYAILLQKVLEGTRGVIAPSQPAPSRQPSSQEAVANLVQIIEAQEDERRRLARQMHDGPAQSLTNLILQAEIVERLFDSDPDAARAEIGNLKNAVNTTFHRIRDFIFNLRPMILDDLGLIPTLRKYVQAFGEEAGVLATLNLVGKETRLPNHAEIVVFRGIQALLDNVHRHAAAANVQVILDIQDAQAAVSVEDNGGGFDTSILRSGKGSGRGGLLTLRNRLHTLGGDLEIDSSAGRGTRVRFYLPLTLS